MIRKISGATVEGWTFIACSLWLLGGIQMFSLDTIGGYVGKVYIETKARLRYIIQDNLLEKRGK